jgi:hypothetical protein
MIPYVLISWYIILNLKINDWITFCFVCINKGLAWIFHQNKFNSEQNKSPIPGQTQPNQIELCKLILQEIANKGSAGVQLENKLNIKEVEQENQQATTSYKK